MNPSIQGYDKPRIYEPPALKCKSSTVDPMAKVMVNNIEHAGMVTHICDRKEHAVDSPCRCKCGHTWIRNYK